MVKLTETLKPNKDTIAAKVIDGEAIIMNVLNGVYYSMENVGAFIWEAIDHGNRIDQIAAAVSEHYGISLEQATEDTVALVEKLLQEDIVTSSTDVSERSDVKKTTNKTETLQYETPKLLIYSDMGDLLALDPPAPNVRELRWKE